MKKSLLLFALCLVAYLLPGQGAESHNKYVVAIHIDSTGRELVEVIVPGRPPDDFRMPPADPTDASYTLPNVPAYDWCYGCSATSAAMAAGYYDRTGYSNMYSGPTNGGVAPMNNSVWGSGECPYSATHQGIDGRSTLGHVDDYWIAYGSSQPDPYITGGWTQHTYGDCTGDYMKTNQSAFGNTDGSTTFYYYLDGSPYSGNFNGNDGTYGVKLFFESRGYTVNNYFCQLIYGFGGNTLGFTYNQFKAEIDAGRPVLIHVEGHTMLGMGYDDASNLIYIHDTWDYLTHSMTWGGSYAGMNQWGVSIVTMAASVPANLTVQNVTLNNGAYACYNATQNITVAGGGTTFIMNNGSEADMIAGQSIQMLIGTHILTGAVLQAYITTNGQYCNLQPLVILPDSVMKITPATADPPSPAKPSGSR